MLILILKEIIDITSKILGERRKLKATQSQRKTEGLSMFKSHRESHCPTSSGEKRETMRVNVMSFLPRTSGLSRKTDILKGPLMPSKHLWFSGSVFDWCLSIPIPNWTSQKLHGSGITIPILKMRNWGSEFRKYLFQDHPITNWKSQDSDPNPPDVKVLWTSCFLKSKSHFPRGLPVHTHHDDPLGPETDSWFLGLWTGPANKDMGITVSSRNKSNFSTCVRVNAMYF